VCSPTIFHAFLQIIFLTSLLAPDQKRHFTRKSQLAGEIFNHQRKTKQK
jgi:hypothetical protein